MKSRLLLVAALAASAAACGGASETAAPMATPTVSVSHARAALGSPIELTYRFQVAPSAVFDKDYRVLVHFLDADDELMWTDDHMPPQPTTTWKPGQTIEYTRTVFVPLYPYIGEATIAVGLYAPGTNDRVPLAGESIGQRSYRVARIRLQPQTDNVFLAYLEGWYSPESAPNNPSIEWQWTRKEGVLRFRNPRRNAVFYLDYDGQPSMFDAPQTVTVSLGAEVIDTFQVSTPEEGLRKIAIKAAQFGPDEMVVIRIAVDKTFVPALVQPDSRDSRELGIRVFHAFVEPE
ncbi:MAG: hypothetical protein ACM3H9_01750 [Rhodospirillaceae bacterium]